MKKLISLLLVLIMALSLVACGGAQAPAVDNNGNVQAQPEAAEKPVADDKVYEIKLVSSLSAADSCIMEIVAATERIKERTNGKVDIQVYPGGEILMNEEGIEAMMNDAAVICVNDPTSLGDYVPVYDTLCCPFLFNNAAEIEAFSETEKWEELMKVGDEAGFHLITSIFNVGGRSVLADGVSLYSVADCKDLNIRIPSVSLFTNFFDALGANYLATGFSAGVTAIETGMLNGIESTPMRVVSGQIYELMDEPVYSVIRYMVNPMALQISYDYWMSLPEDYRTIIEEEFIACAKTNNIAVMEEEAKLLEEMKAAGVKVIMPEEIDMESFYAVADQVNAELADYAAIKAAVLEVRAQLEGNQ